MILVRSVLLLFLIAGLGFGATTTIDLSATTPSPVNTLPASFTTTAVTDTVKVKLGAIPRTLQFTNSTNDWTYIDPVTTVNQKVLKDQSLVLTFQSGTTTFDVTRQTADGTVKVMVLK